MIILQAKWKLKQVNWSCLHFLSDYIVYTVGSKSLVNDILLPNVFTLFDVFNEFPKTVSASICRTPGPSKKDRETEVKMLQSRVRSHTFRKKNSPGSS